MVYSDAASVRMLKSHLVAFRNQPMTDELSLLKNIFTLGRILGLNNAEMSILCFTAVLDLFPAFKKAISVASSETSQHHLAEIIALVTGQKKQKFWPGCMRAQRWCPPGSSRCKHQRLTLRISLDCWAAWATSCFRRIKVKML